MDTDAVITDNGYEAFHLNGPNGVILLSGEDESILNHSDKISDAAVLSWNMETVKLDDHGIDDKFSHSQEEKEAEKVSPKTSELLKSKGNKRNEKSLHAKVTATTVSKRGKGEKDSEADLAISHPKYPAKSRSFNDRNPPSHLSKNGGKPVVASSKASGEQMRLKPLIKGSPSKEEGDAQPTDPLEDDAKPCQAGALPNYGFSFRCHERAEKRREFYSKLEEKIHAKEIEKNNQQAKSKETQEAEIKLLRKNLTFKATPLPNFYQEPPPPKTELKKIPTTRPRSPKLGRKKTAVGTNSEGNGDHNRQTDRLSLDAAICKEPARVSSVPNPKKQIRKSLPKLPSEKTNLPGSLAKSTKPLKLVDKEQKKMTNGAGAEEKSASSVETVTPTSPTQEQEQVGIIEPSQVQADENGVQAVAVEY
ncbi:hypothetical protein SAY87_009638 [Trapa incisa]|uniref:TPX2 C-terminal domain-containing protein n=1 Tax=Trapa incisa TaxID=236973 RepID=A0AAN7PXY6_9MYRT|nr:hypothetical protein SAY87_009638 [Trapa incisa]